MLEIDSELNTNLRDYEILHLLTKNENFSAYKQGFMNFMLMTTVLSGSEKFVMNEFSSCIFYLLIYVSKLMNMCLMRTQFSDGRVDT
jgi:hypothetical protein